VKLALHLNDFNWSGGPDRFRGQLTDIAGAGEAAGFAWLCVADHLWQVPMVGGPEVPQLECYTTLSFLAAHTERVALMAVVSGVHFRQPGLLAKMVTTLDVLSGGRAWLGIGAGHYEEETRGLGIPFPPLGERFEMLEEAVQICLKMWTGDHGDDGAFEGTHYQLGRALNLPQPLSRPHPPILIAGDGEHKTLRLVARYADACSLRPTPELPRKLDVLRKHCDAEGRDFEAIEKTCAFRFDVGDDGSKAGELIGQLKWLAGMGIQTVIGGVPGVERIHPLEIIGREVIPAIAEL
jgi:F420-dependent oxidoreductase-like protein